MFDEITVRNKLKKFYKEFEAKLSEIKKFSLSEDEANNYLLVLVEIALSYFPYLYVDEMVEESSRDSSAPPPSKIEISIYLANLYAVDQKDFAKSLNQRIKNSLIKFDSALCLVDKPLGEFPFLNFDDHWDEDEIEDLKLSVRRYADAKVLKKISKNDCYDLMLDSFFSIFSELDFGKLTHDTPPRIERNRDYPVHFQYPLYWITRKPGSFLGRESDVFYFSDLLGPIYSGLEKYYKFPNALKANYELQKIDNFQTTIQEMHKKDGNS